MDNDLESSPLPRVSPGLKRERSFELSLPVRITGRDATDKEFTEQSEVSRLSAQEAVFRLETRVMAGVKLSIHLQVPRTFLLEKPLELGLSGTVVCVKAGISRSGIGQIVSLRLDRDFHIKSPTC
jgi:hypothetical protein